MGRATQSWGIVVGGVVGALAAAALPACGNDTGDAAQATGEASLSAIRTNLFEGSCALGSCHAPPTVAAKLNLKDDGLCHLLRNKSCLFGDKMLVVPGKPEASFLLDKLRGTNLTGAPDERCGTTNQRMPLGLPRLSAGQIAQVENWIRDGADCGGDLAVDAGVDAPPDGPSVPLADVATLTADLTALKVGDRTRVTVTLTHRPPAVGQTVVVDVDDGLVLGAPNAVRVERDEDHVEFTVLGKAPGSVTLTASAGATAKTITFTVSAASAVTPPTPAVQIAARGALPARGVR